MLYVFPLKALVIDVERDHRMPITGVARHADRMGIAAYTPEAKSEAANRS